MQQALLVPSRAPCAWAYGWVERQGDRMYVAIGLVTRGLSISGLGASILPLRFNQRPEWVMFALSGK